MGLADAVGRDPVVVARVAVRFVKTCSADGFKMPQRVRKSLSVDLDAMVALAPLESALEGLAVLGGHADLADKLPSLPQRRGGASGATPAPAPSTPPA